MPGRRTGTFESKATLLVVAVLCLPLLLQLPDPLFEADYSTVLTDRKGVLLGACIAGDEQWRFPPADSVPFRYAEALIAFEDKRFFRHWGVDPKALARAIRQNLRAGEVRSGGSTLSMQVIRLARSNPPRTLWQKAIEMALALKLELYYSKKEILALYASHAPFGGNVVGLDAASWRYFGKAAGQLSWAEAATLAVLPNQPGLIHPGRNRDRLRAKRDGLLDRMLAQDRLDSLSWSLARQEPLPREPYPLPRLAPHLLERARAADSPAAIVHTSLDADLQQQAQEIIDRHHRSLEGSHINNLAALVLEVETGQALVYLGNATEPAEAGAVDLVTSPRSTGSILKPFLFAHALQHGVILPESLLKDVPASFENFQPKNFHRDHDGLVPASQALQRSLNVPMVFLLQEYGVETFLSDLRTMGLSTLGNAPGHYGLSLILGGAEATLWDLAGAYASMARTLNHHYDRYGRYDPKDLRPATYRLSEGTPTAGQAKSRTIAPWLDAGSIWATFQSMEELERPAGEGRWRSFGSSRRIAWKTGTSFGFRDAWAIGVTPGHVIAVWVGNADGEGRPGLTGIQAAAPVLFDLSDLLPREAWFEPPLDELAPIAICRQSGYRALPICPADTVSLPRSGLRAPSCPYHQWVHLSPDERWQLKQGCLPQVDPIRQSRLVLPPREEYFYRKLHPEYRQLPPLHPACREGWADQAGQDMQLIFPHEPTRILVPVDLDGSVSETVFRLAHRHPERRVYWHLDGTFLGSTQTFHEMALRPSPGQHRLILVDEDGHRLEERIEILPRRSEDAL